MKKGLRKGIKIAALCLGMILCLERDVQAAGQNNKAVTATKKVSQASVIKKAKVKKVREIDKITDFSAVFDAAYYVQRYEDIRNVIRTRLINLDTKIALGESQTGQAMAIYYGVFERDEEQEAFEH